MKKIYLQRVTQGNTVFYSGVCDPRILVELCADTNQEDREKFQRVLDENRVKEIADYVGEAPQNTGMLPTTLVLGTRSRDKLPVTRDPVISQFYYIEVPDQAAEFPQYRDVLDVMDGQHRLISFDGDNRKLAEDVPYEVTFNLYVCPTLSEKRKIFKTTNEKQKPVNSNLLMWFRDKLQMLGGSERIYHPVVELLNRESTSPLCGRIIMGDERIPKGYKARQLIGILDKAKVKDFKARGREIPPEKMFQVISVYLQGWEDVCACKFREPQTGETATKISGLRYILLLLPTFWEYSLNRGQPFRESLLREVLQTFQEALGLEELRNVFTDENWSYAFQGEGATVKLAAEHASLLKTHLQDVSVRNFDPLA